MSYQEWKTFVAKPGAQALMPRSALKEPCPKCNEHKGYSITNDGWAYCESCSWGTPTEYSFTSLSVEILNPDGTTNRERTGMLWLYD